MVEKLHIHNWGSKTKDIGTGRRIRRFKPGSCPLLWNLRSLVAMTRTGWLVAMVLHLQGRCVVRAAELAEHFGGNGIDTLLEHRKLVTAIGTFRSTEPGLGAGDFYSAGGFLLLRAHVRLMYYG